MAVVFVVALFFLKNKSSFINKATQEANETEGLTYSSEILGNLVNRDTDLDGVLDWEESLWGTDPNKKETASGISDSIAIEKLKSQTKQSDQTNETPEEPNNLTETDKFSRELFSTVATLNQAGVMDQATVDKLSNSLSEKVQNSTTRKVFTISNIKIINNDTTQAIQRYNDTLNNIYTKYHIEKGVVAILQEFLTDEENTDILSQLDPIISQSNKIISELLKMQVPLSLSLLHLNFINSSERVVENISDMKLFNSDTIVALSAVSQYEKNTTALEYAANILTRALRQKLNN